jgi:hypothetical protein
VTRATLHPSSPLSDNPVEATRWARSGLMWLTGDLHEAPLFARVSVLGALDEMAGAFAAGLARCGCDCSVDLAQLLGGRAALLGLSRGGRVSAGGSCRFLVASDGWVVVNLARSSDFDLVKAIVGNDAVEDPWDALAAAAATLPAAEFCDRAQLLGVASTALPDDAVRLDDSGEASGPAAVVTPITSTLCPGIPRRNRPVVLDLSALWAGPLCAKLLGSTGARVVKVESRTRPDGARFGNLDFYDWLHTGHESVCLDFSCREDIGLLHELIGAADVVIEASRPRAMEAFGIEPAAVVSGPRRPTWVSITGYGRVGPRANRVAFGDDAAVAGGLVAWSSRGPVFCGDALGDPITGLVAATTALSSVGRGGGEVIDISMVRAVRAVTTRFAGTHNWNVRPTGDDNWSVDVGAEQVEVLRPRAPSQVPPAHSLGADTRQVLAELVSDPQ